jgi:SAM-dependent methyltransferase
MLRKKKSICECSDSKEMMDMSKNIQKDLVKRAYGEIASGRRQSCCDVSCEIQEDKKAIAKQVGYSEEDLQLAPDEANLGLSCGNPVALAEIKEGETVLDLGCGAGFDCFLAAKKVGGSGKVIGVDITPEMIEKAQKSAKKHSIKNVEFRLGDMENLPVKDDSIDVVISNCVINLVPDKKKVFEEIYRVLKKSGRMIISDIVLRSDLSEHIRNNPDAYIGCIAGAVRLQDYIELVKEAGLSQAKILSQSTSTCLTDASPDPIGRLAMQSIEEDAKLEDLVLSIKVQAIKK